MAKEAKTVLKEYFKNGSRPNEEQFHSLIDSCYNEDIAFSSFVSGYHVLTIPERVKNIKREAGQTQLVPKFGNLDGKHSITFNYALPACNLTPGCKLTGIRWNFVMPTLGAVALDWQGEKRNFSVGVNITLAIFNGTDRIFASRLEARSGKQQMDTEIDAKEQEVWQGISVDLVYNYEMVLSKPLSTDFYESEKYDDLLMLGFGDFGLIFTKPV
jgi:hypothetical protein